MRFLDWLASRLPWTEARRALALKRSRIEAYATAVASEIARVYSEENLFDVKPLEEGCDPELRARLSRHIQVDRMWRNQFDRRWFEQEMGFDPLAEDEPRSKIQADAGYVVAYERAFRAWAERRISYISTVRLDEQGLPVRDGLNPFPKKDPRS